MRQELLIGNHFNSKAKKIQCLLPYNFHVNATLMGLTYSNKIILNLKPVSHYLSFCFNVKSDKHSPENSQHCRDRETPLPFYVGVNIRIYSYTQTRSQKILNNLHRLGINISYNRVIELYRNPA